MRGVVFLGERELEIRDFPDPSPGPEEVGGSHAGCQQRHVAPTGNSCRLLDIFFTGSSGLHRVHH